MSGVSPANAKVKKPAKFKKQKQNCQNSATKSDRLTGLYKKTPPTYHLAVFSFFFCCD